MNNSDNFAQAGIPASHFLPRLVSPDGEVGGAGITDIGNGGSSPFLAVGSFAYSGSQPSAGINANASSVARSSFEGTTSSILQATSSSISIGSAATNIFASASGGIASNGTSTANGTLAPGTPPGQFFALLYATAGANAIELSTGGVGAGASTATAMAGGASIQVVNDPAAFGAPTLTLTGITQAIEGNDGVTTLAIAPVTVLNVLATTGTNEQVYVGSDVSGENVGAFGNAAAAANIVFVPTLPASLNAGGASAMSAANELVFGDINLDLSLDANDIDELAFFATRQPGSSVFPTQGTMGLIAGANVLYDVNLNTVVDFQDVETLVHDRIGTEFGDADLDGDVDFSDFISLSNNMGTIGGWAEGDFDGSRFIDLADLDILSANYGFSSASSSTGNPIPEPSGFISIFSLLAMCFGCRYRHNRTQGSQAN